MALVAIYAQEQGKDGATSKNKNGSRDHGRFQINDVSWRQYLFDHNIRLEQVNRDSCLNAYVGAHIFKIRYVACKGDVWCAIGLYHSGNEPYRSTYVGRVFRKYQIIENDKTFLHWLRYLPLYDASMGKWEYFKEGVKYATSTGR